MSPADTPPEETPDAPPGTGEEQEELAAEWESMVDNEGTGERTQRSSSRILDQDEIDSLLGFSNEDLAQEERSDLETILASGMVSYERLPMLEVVFDRLVRLLIPELRNFTSENVEVSIDSISSIRFGDYLKSISLPAMISVFKVEEWDNYGLITADSALIYSTVDVLLGGRRGMTAMRIEGRPYTTIERSLIERMIKIMLKCLSSAFEPLSPVTMSFERLETSPRFATISRPSNAAIVAQVRIDVEDRGGRIELLIPYATLEPVRELLLQMYMGEKFGRDSIWETHLAEELWQTEVDMNVVIDEMEMTLSEIFNLRMGSHIALNAAKNALVTLKCGNVPLYTGRMGRHGNRIAVQINEKLVSGDGE